MCGQQQRVVAVLNTVARLRLRHLRSHSLRSGCSSFTTPVRRSSQPLKPCCWLSTSTGPLAEGGVSATETVQAQAHARLLAEEELTDEEAEATRQSMASNQDWLLGELDSINPHDAPLPSPKTDGCGGEEVPKKSKGVDRVRTVLLVSQAQGWYGMVVGPWVGVCGFD